MPNKLLRNAPKRWGPWLAKKEKEGYSPVESSSAEDAEDGDGDDGEHEDASMLRSHGHGPGELPPALQRGRPPPRRVNMVRRTVLLFPWITSLLLAAFSLYLVLLVRHQQNPAFGRMHWSKNEFGPVHAHITPLDISFTGGVSFDDEGKMYKPHPGKDTYVGAGPLQDKEWDVLTFGRYFIISEDEARDTFGPDYVSFYNPEFEGYVIG